MIWSQKNRVFRDLKALEKLDISYFGMSCSMSCQIYTASGPKQKKSFNFLKQWSLVRAVTDGSIQLSEG